MSDDRQLSQDLEAIASRLRSERHEASPLELDTIKQRVMARGARPSTTKGRPMRSRALVGILSLLVMAGGTGGVIAGGNGNGGGNAANSQYKPGKGCGDKDHNHEREDECKKDNDGDGIGGGNGGGNGNQGNGNGNQGNGNH